MTITAWNQELETGIKELDSQHQQILSKANLILIEAKILPAKPVLTEAISYFVPTLDAHFKTEEAYMSKCGYPEFRTHQAMHSEMTMKVRQLNILIEGNPNPTRELQEFLRLMNAAMEQHMLDEDLRFAQFYKNSQK